MFVCFEGPEWHNVLCELMLLFRVLSKLWGLQLLQKAASRGRLGVVRAVGYGNATEVLSDFKLDFN